MNDEQRNLVNDIEIREENDSMVIRGYVVKWEKRSHPIGGMFEEMFHKGAFAESLNKHDQRALWSHDSSKVLGRTKNETLKLFEDDVGLRFELDLPNTNLGRDTFTSVKRGDVDGVSFGFRAINQDWDTRSEMKLRNVRKADLSEISLVAFPAYPDSEASIRALQEFETKENKRKRLILKTYL